MNRTVSFENELVPLNDRIVILFTALGVLCDDDDICSGGGGGSVERKVMASHARPRARVLFSIDFFVSLCV